MTRKQRRLVLIGSSLGVLVLAAVPPLTDEEQRRLKQLAEH
jgi:hypothetical protein